VADDEDGERDLARLAVLCSGRLEETGDEWEPFRLLDGSGLVVVPVAEFLAELQAQDNSAATLRSYGNDLLLWWRWLAAVGMTWDKVTPVEGRDFARWMRVADKPARPHWREQHGPLQGPLRVPARTVKPAAGVVNAVTGKAAPGRKFAPSTRAHAETVLRHFYGFHLDAGRGPIVNPFPLDRSRRSGRARAGARAPQPAGPVRAGADGPLPAQAAQADPEADP
jgi:Phage integrase, N-terminal SAM-like domain